MVSLGISLERAKIRLLHVMCIAAMTFYCPVYTEYSVREYLGIQLHRNQNLKRNRSNTNLTLRLS